MTDYVTLLKENDLKATFQRINILDVIDKHGHMSVENIYDEIIKVHPSISLATIYKNIILMVEKLFWLKCPFQAENLNMSCLKVTIFTLFVLSAGM